MESMYLYATPQQVRQWLLELEEHKNKNKNFNPLQKTNGTDCPEKGVWLQQEK